VHSGSETFFVIGSKSPLTTRRPLSHPPSVHALLDASREARKAEDYVSGFEHAMGAIEAARSAGDLALEVEGISAALLNAADFGDTARAFELAERGIPIADHLGLHTAQWQLQNILGNLFSTTEDFEAAFAATQIAVSIAKNAGDDRRFWVSRANLSGRWLDQAEAQLRSGDADGARASLEHCVEVTQEILSTVESPDHRSAVFVARGNQGAALECLGRDEEAMHDLDTAFQIGEELGLTALLTNLALYRCRILSRRGEDDRTREDLQRALEEGERVTRSRGLMELYQFAAEFEESRGRTEEAFRYFKRYHELALRLSGRNSLGKARALAVRLEAERTRSELASERMRAQAIERARSELEAQTQRLSREALSDHLTQLANRRHFDATLAVRHPEARTFRKPLLLIYLDIDRFKWVNDHFSHATGDAVLQRVAEILNHHTRSGDLVARLGGEEFGILMGDRPRSRQVVSELGERLRSAVEEADWTEIQPGLQVTASFGIADLGQHPTVAEGLAHADRLMYRAKAYGRNRVEVAL
jgi:two-component system, cell cycle response regulator